MLVIRTLSYYTQQSLGLSWILWQFHYPTAPLLYFGANLWSQMGSFCSICTLLLRGLTLTEVLRLKMIWGHTLPKLTHSVCCVFGCTLVVAAVTVCSLWLLTAPYIEYTVEVVAVNSVGSGLPQSIQVYTRERGRLSCHRYLTVGGDLIVCALSCSPRPSSDHHSSTIWQYGYRC